MTACEEFPESPEQKGIAKGQAPAWDFMESAILRVDGVQIRNIRQSEIAINKKSQGDNKSSDGTRNSDIEESTP